MGQVEPDSLPFCSDKDEAYVPLTYGECLATLRYFVGRWGKIRPEQVQSYTLPSCKSTLLSWANNFSMSEEVRAVQGHHRHSSARLYSRDDVFGAFSLQRQVLSAIRGGWRQVTPQHRGGQCPLQEPTLEQRAGTFEGTFFFDPRRCTSRERIVYFARACSFSGDVDSVYTGSRCLPQPEFSVAAPTMGQDLGDPVEVVTAKTVHRATAYPELERCATFRGVHVKPVC